MVESDGLTFTNFSLNPLPLSGIGLPVGVEFDHRTNVIYWTDEVLHTVNRAAINGSFQEVIVQVNTNSGRKYELKLTS